MSDEDDYELSWAEVQNTIVVDGKFTATVFIMLSDGRYCSVDIVTKHIDKWEKLTEEDK